MVSSESNGNVLLDLNNPTFQENLFGLQKLEKLAALDTLKKIRQLNWTQVYRDNGLKWEKVVSVRPPQGIDAIYSLRITQSRRATAYRDGPFMRFLTVAPHHSIATATFATSMTKSQQALKMQRDAQRRLDATNSVNTALGGMFMPMVSASPAVQVQLLQ